MQYKSYPKVKDTPSRNSRKAERIKVFQYNKTLAKKQRKERRLARKAAAAAAAEAVEE